MPALKRQIGWVRKLCPTVLDGIDPRGRRRPGQTAIPARFHLGAGLLALLRPPPIILSSSPSRAPTPGCPSPPPPSAPKGEYVSMWNVVAAGSVIAADPTVLVFLRFQRYFVAGLNLGAVK
ncbi:MULTISPECIES: sugar ABC transporter permease [Streptomyces]|uniref:Sugar ABC transporter permease n=1 Tax=Streptomyces evansiae TaxID=3075535 RepID=A0ABU2R4B6_9ACTN|nr:MULTISPECIES: sugar ABC transporter permease [unclassified Streptomyces]MDT0410914.1 sugar ABC transporter permease [Streptomyces sp. DSM 41979]